MTAYEKSIIISVIQTSIHWWLSAVIQISNWGDGSTGLFGMYQADGIKVLSFEGREYVLTANEGDTKEYEGIGLAADWSETQRGRDILESRVNFLYSHPL